MNPPDVKAHYLIEVLSSLGFIKSTGFGLEPITFLDINQWIKAYGVKLSIWEIEQILSLSRQYVVKNREFDEKPAAAPYTETVTARVDVSKRLRQAFATRSKANKRNPPLRLRSDNNEQQ
ncbi:MAG: hypothetical protein LC687_05395 [Actinobacteria bacterium]|nr:hypothetical protein [Actinomycetota bacterium]